MSTDRPGDIDPPLESHQQAPSETPLIDFPDEELDELIWTRLLGARRDWIEQTDSAPWTEPWFSQHSPLVRAYLATRDFENEVSNGGLYQYFYNNEERPWLFQLVIDGYGLLGLDDLRQKLLKQVLPIARSVNERELRALDRRTRQPKVAVQSKLNALDSVVSDNTAVRIKLIRRNPQTFGL